MDAISLGITKDEHCLSRNSFVNQVKREIPKLTNRARYRNPGEYILIRRLEYLCHDNGMNLSEFFLRIERSPNHDESVTSDKKVDTNARLYYEVLDSIEISKAISDYSICIANGWDYSNFRREKQLAKVGLRKTFSLMKLFGILSVMDISFSYFFLCCEDLQNNTLYRN